LSRLPLTRELDFAKQKTEGETAHFPSVARGHVCAKKRCALTNTPHFLIYFADFLCLIKRNTDNANEATAIATAMITTIIRPVLLLASLFSVAADVGVFVVMLSGFGIGPQIVTGTFNDSVAFVSVDVAASGALVSAAATFSGVFVAGVDVDSGSFVVSGVFVVEGAVVVIPG